MAALNPGAGAAVLDYAGNANDLKFYQKAVKGLDESERYDLTPGKLKAFLDNVKQKVIMCGWLDIITVPTIVAPIVNCNFLDNYGTVSMAECTAHATGYMTTAPLGRPAQNAVMFYHFLFASLTPEARNKVNVDPTAYTIGGNEEGLCFLRTIITKAQLDTIGTAETLRASIGKLETKIVELTGNIIDFHLHVNTITNALDSYGQAYPELILNLFKAYSVVEDNEFTTYVMVTRFGYNANPGLYNVRSLMDGVENIYKLRIEAGTWKPSLTSQTNEIAALQAQITALTAQVGTGNNNSTTTNQNQRNQRQAKKEKDAWKSVPPTGNEKTTIFENRTYHWCPNHKMWTMHKPEECQGINFRPGQTSAGNNVATPQANESRVNATENPPVVRVNEAMSAIVRYGESNLS
jgi:hypothetical protein